MESAARWKTLSREWTPKTAQILILDMSPPGIIRSARRPSWQTGC
jgi:hypothetical protein